MVSPDPEDPTEAESDFDQAPSTSYEHAERGWALLNDHNPRKAKEHFREALRLSPQYSWATRGLLEAMQETNALYRWMMYFLEWLVRHNFTVHICFSCLLFLVYELNATELVIVLLFLGYFALFFGKHFTIVLLLLSSDGRLVWDWKQKWISGICVMSLLSAYALVGCVFAELDPRALWAAFFTLVFAFNVNSAFEIPPGRRRWMGIGLSAVVLGMLGWLMLGRIDVDRETDEVNRQVHAYNAMLHETKTRWAGMTREERKSAEEALERSHAELEASREHRLEHEKELDSWQTEIWVAVFCVFVLHRCWR